MLASFYRTLGVLLVIALLGGCTSPREQLGGLAEQAGYRLETLSTQAFPLQAVLPAHFNPRSVLRVYLEGDGHAWATASQPSLDPTPHELLMARLAMSDPGGAVYLARPCQFIMSNGCSTAVWTSQRFSQAVISSMSMALDALKVRTQATKVELVGYSGGAAVALLLAGQRNDVVSIQTLAGNLDPVAWTEWHQLSPMSGSLDPSSYKARLRSIPQRHLVGSRDTVVPWQLSKAFAGKFGDQACISIITVEADHNEGWEAAWRAWEGKPLPCHRTSE
jgi:pimeloyl-ACP methyl ester carboxylesterase